MKEKQPSKLSIVLAWIVLLFCIISAAALTYLKFFYEDLNNKNMEEYSTNNTELSPVILEALQTIIKNFNESDMTKKYQEENIKINAYLEDNNIKVDYSKENEKRTYEFNFAVPILTSTITKEQEEEFKNIFKIMIYACQKRLDNNIDVDKITDNFYKGTPYVGLVKEEKENNITYGIDVSKNITEVTEEKNTNETTDTGNEN